MVNLDKLTYAGNRCSLSDVIDDPRHRFVEGDIADAPLVAELLEEHRPAAIVHLAAETHVDRSIAEPPQFALTNVVGTCTLLDVATHYWQQLEDTARAKFRFLLVSTDEVFGSAAPNKCFDEQTPLAPSSPYAASKAAAEHMAGAFSRTYGLPILTANPSNNYGPRQYPEKLIPKMIVDAAAGKPLGVYGDGLHERDWIHVDDCCRALRLVLDRGEPGRRYLVGAKNCRSNLEIVEMIYDFVDQIMADGRQRRELVTSVTDRLGHDRRYAVDARFVQATTGWQPNVALADGLRQTVQWYLGHPEWVDEVRGKAVS